MGIQRGFELNFSRYMLQTLKLSALGLLLLFCFFTANKFNFTGYFPIKTVRVYGANRIDHQELQGLLSPLVKHGFFAINVQYIKDRLQQIPWVADIFVRRTWPDQIDITIVEKEPVALWNDHSLLSSAGQLFSPDKERYPFKIPQFIGPPGQQIKMLQYFNEINRLLAPINVKIAHLELTAFLSWKLMLDNGIVVQAGHKDVLTRLEQFVRVYPKIVGTHAADVEYVDLRYPNGIALRWKDTVKT